MKVNFNRKIRDFKGLESNEAMSDIVAQALYQAGGNEDGLTADDKFRAYKLCQCVISASERGESVNISAEDAALIKKVCEKCYVAGAYGQICEIIEVE